MSDAGSDASKLVEVLEEVRLHDHLCVIYENQEEQLAVPPSSIRMGLDRGEKCIYIADENTVSDVIAALHALNIDVDQAVNSGRLTVAAKEDAYLRNGHFEPDKMISFWADALPAIASGFSGLRVIGEMSWALGGDPGPGPLIEYEAKLNHFVRDHPSVVTCQYDCKRFSPEVILNVIRTHPIVVYGRSVCANPYYVPPEEFLAPNHAEMEVKRLLANIHDRQQAERELRTANQRLQNLSRQLLDVQERERRFIAHELHDEIGQLLTVTKLDLQAAKDSADDASRNQLLEESISALDRLLEQIRSLSLELRPPMLDDLGLVPALRWFVKHQGERAGLRTNFFADSLPNRLDPAREIACFRLVQEALTNVARHACAKSVRVEMRFAGGEVHIIIRDDGAGFDAKAIRQQAERGASLGLLGMEERVRLVGGQFNCQSAPGQGTEIHADFPLRE
jgi:signal transduction histidine kinase